MPWEELSWGHAGLPFTELQGLFVLGEYSAEIPLPIGAPKPFPCSKCLCPPKAWPRTQTLMKTLPDSEQLPCLFSQDFHETVNMSNMSFISKTIFSHFFSSFVNYVKSCQWAPVSLQKLRNIIAGYNNICPEKDAFTLQCFVGKVAALYS